MCGLVTAAHVNIFGSSPHAGLHSDKGRLGQDTCAEKKPSEHR